MSDIPIDLEPKDIAVYTPDIREGRIIKIYRDCTLCIAAKNIKGGHNIYKYYCTLSNIANQNNKDEKQFQLKSVTYQKVCNMLNKRVVHIKCKGISKFGRLLVQLHISNTCVNTKIADIIAMQNYLC